MVTLMPRSYGGWPSIQFGPPDRFYNQSYGNGYWPRQSPPFAPRYTAQPFAPPSFYGIGQQPIVPVQKPGLATELVFAYNQLDERYRYERYVRNAERMRQRYWREQANRMPLPLYTQPQGNVFENYEPRTSYVYEQEIRYVPYPIYVGPGTQSYGTGANIGYGTSSSLTLPPKIRVIFMPTGYPSLQQPSMGPLAMPPFLFNRMAQPLCSFPLPPPLPQIGSLPVSPAVQQMVMERYANPIAVFPFSPNWQMPQMMMPAFAPLQQSIMPAFAQQQPMMPMSGFPSLPPAPQLFIPPPVMPSNIPILPPPPMINSDSSVPQYISGGYPSICRACPPAPPPLTIPVTGHCWVQHCCACHQVPISSFSNARPAGGRITPLLRYPTVPQYVPHQTYQEQQNLHANAPVMMRPWLRKTPPLPPGAIVISDEYIGEHDSGRRHHRSRAKRKKSPHATPHVQRSTAPTVTTTTNRRSRSGSPQAPNTNNNNNSNQYYQEFVKSKSTTSTSSTATSSSSEHAEYQRTILNPPATYKKRQKPTTHHSLSTSRDVKFQYNYQPHELSTVYHVNSCLKSSSEDSMRTPNRPPSLLAKEYSQIPPAPLYFDSKSDKNNENSLRNLSITSSITEKPKEKSLIIREFVASSPSIISTISSNASFSIILKDSDSISTTSTLVADKDEDDVLII